MREVLARHRLEDQTRDGGTCVVVDGEAAGLPTTDEFGACERHAACKGPSLSFLREDAQRDVRPTRRMFDQVDEADRVRFLPRVCELHVGSEVFQAGVELQLAVLYGSHHSDCGEALRD
jgi:hypothetical protein